MVSALIRNKAFIVLSSGSGKHVSLNDDFFEKAGSGLVRSATPCHPGDVSHPQGDRYFCMKMNYPTASCEVS
jgi:hypothetical protein